MSFKDIAQEYLTEAAKKKEKKVEKKAAKPRKKVSRKAFTEAANNIAEWAMKKYAVKKLNNAARMKVGINVEKFLKKLLIRGTKDLDLYNKDRSITKTPAKDVDMSKYPDLAPKATSTAVWAINILKEMKIKTRTDVIAKFEKDLIKTSIKFLKDVGIKV